MVFVRLVKIFYKKFILLDKASKFINYILFFLKLFSNQILFIPETISSAISSACFSTVSVASSCISGG